MVDRGQQMRDMISQYVGDTGTTPMTTLSQESPDAPNTAPTTDAGAIGSEQLREFTKILNEYKAGKAHLDERIISSEEWWKLHNTHEERRDTDVDPFAWHSRSGWLHNVIVNKHADAMESYPEPTILPREPNDRTEATKLSAILPCVLEMNDFEETYSKVIWSKLKSGTGVYKVTWDSSKLNGLGDISIEQCNILNLFWQSGVTDIQKSKYFFHTELADISTLEEQYPQLKGKLHGNSFTSKKFLYDDSVDTTDKTTVIDVYYHTYVNGQPVLQYCKYVEEEVLYATENEPDMAERGLYDHGMFPYVFDVLYPIEGSPCGYGFVDLCRSPQTEIDKIKTALVENAMVTSTPRYFIRQDGSVNEQEFMDLNRKLIHSDGNLGEDSIRLMQVHEMSSNYVSLMQYAINELREVTGNTETATGSASAGITAASAIAALQTASGKGSSDSSRTSYRSFRQVTELCVELIRQFYDMPRSFRITGNSGHEQFTSYTNQGLQPQYQGTDFGIDQGYRMPVFDIKISAQKATQYTKVTQNELALQFFQLGFFNPQASDQALATLSIMDFDGKEETMQLISRNGTMYQQLLQWEQLALTLAQQYQPDLVNGLSQQIMQQTGQPVGNPQASVNMKQTDNISGVNEEEHPYVKNAREHAEEASQPNQSAAVSEKKK